MISVIIPSYRNPKCLDICLESALKNQHKENQIICVLDGYVEESQHIVEKYKDKVFCDLKSVEDWLVVDKNCEDDECHWKGEEDDKLYPSGFKLMINTYANKPDVIGYLKTKITNIETFYLS